MNNSYRPYHNSDSGRRGWNSSSRADPGYGQLPRLDSPYNNSKRRHSGSLEKRGLQHYRQTPLPHHDPYYDYSHPSEARLQNHHDAWPPSGNGYNPYGYQYDQVNNSGPANPHSGSNRVYPPDNPRFAHHFPPANPSEQPFKPQNFPNGATRNQGPRDEDRTRLYGTPKVGTQNEIYGDHHIRPQSLPSLHGQDLLHDRFRPPRGEDVQWSRKDPLSDIPMSFYQSDRSCLQYLSDPQNAEMFIDEFIRSCVGNNLVLEIAAEILVKAREFWALTDRTPKPVVDALNDLVYEVLNKEIHDIANTVTQDEIIGFWKSLSEDFDLCILVSAEILDDVLQEMVGKVAHDAVNDMVGHYFEIIELNKSLDPVYDDVLASLIQKVVKEVLYEEDMKSVADEMIDSMTGECADEFMHKVYAAGRPVLPLNTPDKLNQDMEIKKLAAEYLPDSLIMDELLQWLVMRHQVWTDAEYKDRYLDGLFLDQLISQRFKLLNSVDATDSNLPVKGFYEKLNSDVAADTLVDELSEHLIQDMKDQDEKEIAERSTSLSSSRASEIAHIT